LFTTQFTTQSEKIGFYYYQKLYELLPDSRVWHVLLTIGFVKGTRGYVEKLELKPCLCLLYSITKSGSTFGG